LIKKARQMVGFFFVNGTASVVIWSIHTPLPAGGLQPSKWFLPFVGKQRNEHLEVLLFLFFLARPRKKQRKPPAKSH
jgi:hypothetical protein